MTATREQLSRSDFLVRAGGFVAGAFLFNGSFTGLAPTHAHGTPLEHPEPREGITAENVLPVDKLGTKPSERVLQSYEFARNHPAMFDGILCSCSCGGKRGTHRSLLSCFESPQATGCGECQLEGVFVGKLAAEKKSLDEIRVAFDKEFG
jgi:hypothetical protein